MNHNISITLTTRQLGRLDNALNDYLHSIANALNSDISDFEHAYLQGHLEVLNILTDEINDNISGGNHA